MNKLKLLRVSLWCMLALVLSLSCAVGLIITSNQASFIFTTGQSFSIQIAQGDYVTFTVIEGNFSGICQVSDYSLHVNTDAAGIITASSNRDFSFYSNGNEVYDKRVSYRANNDFVLSWYFKYPPEDYSYYSQGPIPSYYHTGFTVNEGWIIGGLEWGLVIAGFVTLALVVGFTKVRNGNGGNK